MDIDKVRQKEARNLENWKKDMNTFYDYGWIKKGYDLKEKRRVKIMSDF